MPARVELLEQWRDADREVFRRLDELRAQFLEDLRSATTQVHRNFDVGRGALETKLDAAMAEQLRKLDGAIAEQGNVMRTALASSRRDAVVGELYDMLGAPLVLQPGLSIFTITWNHGDHLADAIAGGLAALDSLDESCAGELLLLDDGSTDATQEVVAEAAARDSRVRAIRAPANIGVARARNVLLHACDREHALMLDADNLVDPDGLASVYAVAATRRSVLTYGVLAWRHAEGEFIRFGSAGPLSPRNLDRLDIDTFAIIDVAAIRHLGGWTLDPALDAFDDQELVRRVAYHGGLIGFVPVLMGTYQRTNDSHSQSRGDVRPRHERIRRMYMIHDTSPIAAFVAHPEIGPLWMSDAARLREAGDAVALDDPPAIPAAEAFRILVVAPGGVGNLGDDLITMGILDRLARVCPSHDVELVTDGPTLPVDLGPVAWDGTLPEIVEGLEPDGESCRAAGGCSAVDLSGFDLAILAGGGNLNSLWRDDLVANRAMLLNRLAAASVPVLATGQGIGPFTTPDDARVVTGLLRSTASVSVRDVLSRAALADVDAESIDVALIGDDALGLAPVDDAVVRSRLMSIGVSPREPFVVLHVRHAEYIGIDDADRERWAAALDDVAAERGAAVVGVALNWEPPTPEPIALLRLARFKARRAPWRVVDDPTRPRLVAGVLRRADCALVCSYHAALIGVEAGVPTLYCAGTPYSRQKAEGLRQLAELPAAFVVGPGADPEELRGRLEAVADALSHRRALTERSVAADEWLRARVASLLPDRAPAS